MTEFGLGCGCEVPDVFCLTHLFFVVSCVLFVFFVCFLFFFSVVSHTIRQGHFVFLFLSQLGQQLPRKSRPHEKQS